MIQKVDEIQGLNEIRQKSDIYYSTNYTAFQSVLIILLIKEMINYNIQKTIRGARFIQVTAKRSKLSTFKHSFICTLKNPFIPPTYLEHSSKTPHLKGFYSPYSAFPIVSKRKFLGLELKPFENYSTYIYN